MATRKEPDPGIRKSTTRMPPGLDAMTGGGLPQGAVTRVVGTTGAGKTFLALQALARAAQAGEPGIFVAFEEPSARIVADPASFGWGLPALLRRRMLLIAAPALPRASPPTFESPCSPTPGCTCLTRCARESATAC
jgi:KaiC/GvpD/RAD55 family RecA-like ATPase